MPQSSIRAAMAHYAAGRADEAQAILRRLLAQEPAAFAGLHLLGLCLSAQTQYDDASRVILWSVRAAGPRSESLLGNFAVALVNGAAARGRDGRNEAAMALCRRALAISPDSAEALAVLAAARLRAEGRDEAVAILRRLTALNPTQDEHWRSLGELLNADKRHEEAWRALRTALTLTPDDARHYMLAGATALSSGDADQATTLCRRALRLDGEYAAAGNLGLIYMRAGHIAAALAMTRAAAALRPEVAETWVNLGSAHIHAGDPAASARVTRHALTLRPAYPKAHSNILIALEFLDIPPLDLLAEHRRFDALHGRPRTAHHRRHDNAPDPDRPLRVGYVSGDFRQHVAACFFEPLLAAHDPAQVEAICYSDTATPDGVTRRLTALSAGWRDIVNHGEAAVDELIRADRIDILVDLCGHSADNRQTVFARRPAPIQATWLGYPDTSGLSAMDYRLVDAITDPAGPADGLAAETLIRIPGGFLCYWPPTGTPEPGPAAADRPLTFGSFNKLAKAAPATIDAWADILRRTPDSRLLLKMLGLGDADVRAGVERSFAARGVDPARLELVSWSPSWLDHLKLYDRIDIALDTFPYNGTTTTCEALWMGVPVVCWPGERHAARVGASLLRHAGLPDLVAPDRDGYVDLAVGLAGDRPRLTALRAGLRAHLRASPLCDAHGFARRMEGTYRQLWRQWCAARNQ